MLKIDISDIDLWPEEIDGPDDPDIEVNAIYKAIVLEILDQPHSEGIEADINYAVTYRGNSPSWSYTLFELVEECACEGLTLSDEVLDRALEHDVVGVMPEFVERIRANSAKNTDSSG
ncbi:hypothetical protein KRX51_03185 [Corynebacterium sp. TAE3-ERU12]|uniref:hypothetical protein n=1 Tax=Corynebacterium sp. TAE3-ERU12 TaxID=2849491 RepID=UPI001C486BA5|nr:hypothetical protein [Corynebacterium sp. TAE3-ERU12]MBV7294922.1 hypothetical protein [Corynebacterium sp. TAE3-ERU12]